MTDIKATDFDIAGFLTRPGWARRKITLRPKDIFFAQGEPASSVYYLKSGRARLSMKLNGGKEATIMLLVPGDFFGEESLTTAGDSFLTTAAALTECTAFKLDKHKMVDAMHEEHALSVFMVKFLLDRSMRVQADLVDQLFNSTEKRLARILLLMADYDQPGGTKELVPAISQETLADLIGTTRSQVNFFMTRFRAKGYIQYKDRIRVHKSLVNVLLHD